MKLYKTFLLALSGVIILSCSNHDKKQIAGSEISDFIRINQVGYYPSLGKSFTVANAVAYPDTHPARSYIDHTSSYASNEVCINWNAPLVLVLAYLDQQ
jgi:hypothetical protein